ncbi:MAG: cache domain-containing protein [Planctomycetota bacterium]|jgi:serine phosphatase RsbU (regulator of sigma subunit)/signal transduction histidine kinase
MTIKIRILAVTVPTLLLAVIVVTVSSVIIIREQYAEEVTQYRSEEMIKIRDKLKNLVDTAYSSIESNHRQAQDKESLEKIYGSRLMDIVGIAESIVEEAAAKAESEEFTEAEAKGQASEAIRKIRYGNGTGYLWINDVGRPFPKMVMHPFTPELEGQVLDDPQYNCALGRKENLFKAFVDVCTANGEGFVDYLWPKPKAGTSELIPDVPKLSYVRLFEEWGWILGTGVYIDDALIEAIQNSKDRIRNVRYDYGTGYFWINDTMEPFPKMVMHPMSPELEGKVLDDPQYNCALGRNENLFKAFVDVCKADGEGFVDYLWGRPTAEGLSEPVPKLSYVRLYEPLGWVLGTGVYTDEIDAAIGEKMEAMTAQVNGLIGKVVLFSAIMCGLAIAASMVSAKTISRPVGKLIGTMRSIRHEGLSKKRTSPGGASEIRDLGDIFNEMMDAIDEGVDKLEKETANRARMEQDLEIARSIQQGLLPRQLLEIEGFDIAGWNQPADQTGGDYFDWQETLDGRVAISLADVTGHGIGPALVTAVCRAYSRANISTETDLGMVIDRINNMLVEDLPTERFVTFVVALLDPTNSKVQLLSAGHGPILLYTASDDRIQDFDADDIPLGLAPNVGYGPAKEIMLAGGDMLVLITDGFFEWTNADREMFGLERLQETIRKYKDLPAKEIISKLYKEVVKFTRGTKQQDDLTAVILKRRCDA